MAFIDVLFLHFSPKSSSGGSQKVIDPALLAEYKLREGMSVFCNNELGMHLF